MKAWHSRHTKTVEWVLVVIVGVSKWAFWAQNSENSLCKRAHTLFDTLTHSVQRATIAFQEMILQPSVPLAISVFALQKLSKMEWCGRSRRLFMASALHQLHGKQRGTIPWGAWNGFAMRLNIGCYLVKDHLVFGRWFPSDRGRTQVLRLLRRSSLVVWWSLMLMTFFSRGGTLLAKYVMKKSGSLPDEKSEKGMDCVSEGIEFLGARITRDDDGTIWCDQSIAVTGACCNRTSEKQPANNFLKLPHPLLKRVAAKIWVRPRDSDMVACKPKCCQKMDRHKYMAMCT